MRTVASLTLEDERVDEYNVALDREDPHPVKTNLVKGSASGLGQFMQFWAFGLMFWVRIAVVVTLYRLAQHVLLYSHHLCSLCSPVGWLAHDELLRCFLVSRILDQYVRLVLLNVWFDLGSSGRSQS